MSEVAFLLRPLPLALRFPTGEVAMMIQSFAVSGEAVYALLDIVPSWGSLRLPFALFASPTIPISCRGQALSVEGGGRGGYERE